MKFKPSTPPNGCQSAEDHERELVATAAFLEGHARRLLESNSTDKQTRILLATGNQIMVSAIKARRAAAELAARREDIEHADYLVTCEREMAGVRAPDTTRRLTRRVA